MPRMSYDISEYSASLEYISRTLSSHRPSFCITGKIWLGLWESKSRIGSDGGACVLARLEEIGGHGGLVCELWCWSVELDSSTSTTKSMTNDKNEPSFDHHVQASFPLE